MFNNSVDIVSTSIASPTACACTVRSLIKPAIQPCVTEEYTRTEGAKYLVASQFGKCMIGGTCPSPSLYRKMPPVPTLLPPSIRTLKIEGAQLSY